MESQSSIFDYVPLSHGAGKLLEHQIEGIDWLKRTPRALLADEPGLGKTAQMLLAAVEPVLVVAPAMVLDSGTWDDEIAKWAPGLDVTQVSYSSLNVRNERGKVNRDHNGVPVVQVKPEYRRQWGTVIADESHYLKGRKTSWTRGFFQLRSQRLILATGTPLPNWAHEAFTALQLIYPEEATAGRRLGSYWRWVQEWFEVGATLFTQRAVGDPIDATDEGWARFRRENWGNRMLLRLRKDCLDLPPLTQQEWRLPMEPAQRKAYNELKRDFITWLDSGEEIAAWSSAAQLVKLSQAATGLEVLGSEAKSSNKLKALAAILEDRPLPTLVVGHFRATVRACAEVARKQGKRVAVVDGGTARGERAIAVRAFQGGQLDVLVATIDTIAEGMTLHQGGADQIVRVERSARPSKNEQVLRRLHRMGVERPITAIDLVSENTVDEKLLAMLATKTDQQMRALGTQEIRGLVH